MPETLGGAEVLEHGTSEQWPWRRIGALMLVVAVGVGGLVAADRAAREREQTAVAECMAAGDAAVDRAWEPVIAMAYYIRPTLFQVPDEDARDGIFGLVAGEADGRDRFVSEARAACADISIWWLHGDLRDQRDTCSGTLRAEAERLAAVARDGRVAFEGESLARCGRAGLSRR